MSKVNFGIKDGSLEFAVDLNEDGEPSLKGKLNLGEAAEEAIKREGAVEGAKIVDFKFAFTKLTLKIDTDRDGENLLELEIDLGEAFQEIRNQK